LACGVIDLLGMDLLSAARPPGASRVHAICLRPASPRSAAGPGPRMACWR